MNRVALKREKNRLNSNNTQKTKKSINEVI